MRKTRKLLCMLLALIMTVSLFSFTAYADTEEDYLNDPIVFVHGLFGWGDRAKANALFPYWGMMSGSLTKYLNSKGYETYAATVGPLSGAWDRACELYAQLTGTTVDYGVAHSQEIGHDRFGITYDKPIFEGWGPDKKVNLVGHSFGGATTRLFLEILANGAPEEVAAAKAAGVKVSPFFEGGKGDWVHSLFEISAPHNGTTFIESCPNSTSLVTELIKDLGAAIGLSDLKGVYDLQLEHFGFKVKSNETALQAVTRLLTETDFMKKNDNAIYDLTIDNALKINDRTGMEKDIYYFSVTGDKTMYSKTLHKQVVDPGMFVVLQPFGTRMCNYYDKYTAGGVYIDESWIPNDGMVNTVSGRYPVKSNMKCLKADGTYGFVIYDGYGKKDFDPGVWNVLPTVPYDHAGTVGGLLTNSIADTRLMYLDWVDTIYSTYGKKIDTPVTDDSLPFTDVAKDRWSYDYILEMYKLGAVNGKTDTIFDPAGNVTRAEFVKMLGCLDGINTDDFTSCRFKDVSNRGWAAPYIEWAADNGIVNGYDKSHFGPNDKITREQMSAILCRYAEYAGISLDENTTAITFTDEGQISAYALENVKTLQRAGVIGGFDNGDGTFSFQPKGYTTREQACKVLCLI